MPRYSSRCRASTTAQSIPGEFVNVWSICSWEGALAKITRALPRSAIALLSSSAAASPAALPHSSSVRATRISSGARRRLLTDIHLPSHFALACNCIGDVASEQAVSNFFGVSEVALRSEERRVGKEERQVS